MEINKIYNEPCLDTIKNMPDDFLDCVITSPPYWQLRDYGYEGQWGLEPTHKEYLENLWSMMDEIYRVLKPTGTVWVNLGDTYGDKKCLMLIPHRFAIGCIDRGWIMRNDIVWAKRNNMPESVTDRFSKKHEYFFFMTKQENYFFDLDSIRDKHKSIDSRGSNRIKYNGKGNANNFSGDVDFLGQNPNGKNCGDVADFWDIPTKPNKEKHYASYNDTSSLSDCGCNVGFESGLVYDPFMGTGSTGEVCIRAKRNYIGSEMSKEYIEIANKRLDAFLQQPTLF